MLASGARPRWAGGLAAAVLLSGLLLTLITAYSIVSGDFSRVVDAKAGEEGIYALVLSDGREITFKEPVDSPVKPVILPDGRPSIIGHLVRVEGDSVTIVYHWSTSFSVALYSILVAGSLFLLYRGWRP